MTPRELRTLDAALRAIEIELRALHPSAKHKPKGEMSRHAHVAFVAAWSILARHARHARRLAARASAEH